MKAIRCLINLTLHYHYMAQKLQSGTESVS